MGKIRLMKQFMWGVAVYVIATGEHGPCRQHEEAGSQAETPHIATVPSMVACVDVGLSTSFAAVPALPWLGAGSITTLLIPPIMSCLAGLAACLGRQAGAAGTCGGAALLDFVWCHPHRALCQPTCKHPKANFKWLLQLSSFCCHSL